MARTPVEIKGVVALETFMSVFSVHSLVHQYPVPFVLNSKISLLGIIYDTPGPNGVRGFVSKRHTFP